MAVDGVTKKWSTDEGSDQSDDGREWRRSVAEVYQVTVTDGATTSPYEAKFATGIPLMRSPHPLDVSMRVNSVQPRRVSPIMWEVYVSYGSTTSNKNEDEPPTHPLAEPPIIRWFAVRSEDETDEDVDGNAHLNTVGDPLGPIPVEIIDLGLHVHRNLAANSPLLISTYTGAVNSDKFGPFPAGTARVMDVQIEEKYEEEYVYYPTDIEIHIRRGIKTTDAHAWWVRRRNEGFYYYWDVMNKKKRRATDDSGAPTTNPVLLNEDGSLVDVKNGDPAHWLEFQQHPAKPFSVLNIL